MKTILFAILTIAVIALAGCDATHRHEQSGHGEPHEQGHTENVQVSASSTVNNSGHEDAFGRLDLNTEDSRPEPAIFFGREQQKIIDFSTVAAVKRKMRASLKATGMIKASPYRQTIITAPISGYLSTVETPFPHFGDEVKTGEVVAIIVPSINGDSDPASLELAVRRSRSNYQLAREELDRVETLFNEGAVSERRVHQARKEEQVARAEMISAEQRTDQYRSRPEKRNGTAVFEVTSPINGTLDGIYVMPGTFLKEGDPLFHIVDSAVLRLVVKIPEADLWRLADPRGAWFTVDGSDVPFEIDLAKGGRLFAAGNVIDPKTRTAPLMFEFPNPNDALRVGMFAQVNVVTGKPKESVAIPRAAVQEHNGIPVVYVQSGDDTFERRIVNLGTRDGAFVEVKKGVFPGENVVTNGAYLVQLAASGPQEAGHGHAH